MRGEPEALEAFVRRHERWVRGVIFGVTGRGDLVDDVTQQVWTTVWQQIGTLRDRTRWRAWLYQLVRRAAIDANKQWKRRWKSEIPIDPDMPFGAGAASSPEAALIADDRHRQVMQAVQSLPPHYREPFVLKHLEDWRYAQIGEVLGLPVDTVETRLVRARRMLREMLQWVS